MVNDTLSGGAGSDILIGGDGADRFVFNSASQGVDSIIDFRVGDRIVINRSFGATSLNQFTLDPTNGAIFFEQQQIASINFDFASQFDVNRDIVLL